ncbi:nucleoside-triphosphatase THEP1 [Roseovarius sp. MBR-154]|jgi:nucleoside-triphosphatase THEP1
MARFCASARTGGRWRACRLDPDALEAAVGLVAARLTEGADLLIINKFGKHEAEGRGFRDVIAEALSQGVPILIGLNALTHAAFEDFAHGMARRLPAQAGALRDWAQNVAGTAAQTT